MPNKIKKKNDDGFQIHGINGCYNIIQVKKINILRIDIMVNGIAEKKKWVMNLISSNKYPIHRIPKPQFLKKHEGKRTQGIVVSFKGKILKEIPSFENDNHNSCLLVMDNLEDPQNMGQIVRTAECAGIDGIIIPEHGSVQATNTVLQVSQGAFVHMPFYKCGNLHQQLRILKDQGFWAIGMENNIKAKHWCQFDFKRKIVLVVGSEGKGIRPIIMKTCDELLTIPMAGKINSLNVSSAVSAILFERHRQMLQDHTK